MTAISENNYLVWSHEHGMWWRANSRGYTPDTTDAGVYTRKEALEICAFSRDGWGDKGVPSEIPVRQIDVIDCQLAWAAAMKVLK